MNKNLKYEILQEIENLKKKIKLIDKERAILQKHNKKVLNILYNVS